MRSTAGPPPPAFQRFSQPDCQGLFCLRRHTTKFFEQNRNRPKSRPAVSRLIIKSEHLFLIRLNYLLNMPQLIIVRRRCASS